MKFRNMRAKAEVSIALLLLVILLIASVPITVVAAKSTKTKLSAITFFQEAGGGYLMPDLTISSMDIVFTPSEPILGETVTITAKVYNVGGAQAQRVEVGFYDNVTGVIGVKKIGLIKAGETGTASVKWTAKPAGIHKITVVVDPNNKILESNEINNQSFRTIAILEVKTPPPTPPPTPPANGYALFIEIDYMEGHKPNTTVLTYIRGYYYDRGITVTFYVNDTVPYSASVTDAEFWAIEAKYNNMGDDSASGNPGTGIYFSKWKWVLYGSSVSGQSNVVGYCYCVMQSVSVGQWDLLAGNYMYMADETADNWAVSRGIKPYGAEAVVLMHETGHSIGIGILDSWGREVYCRDVECVMAPLLTYNADNYLSWYYCADHWATKNLEYYTT